MMETEYIKVAFGGSCHWCTEAIFHSLVGVYKVEQGFVAPAEHPEDYSEAVVVYFNPLEITLKTLIEIHLRTHSSTKIHSRRGDYRSAVYTFSAVQEQEALDLLRELQNLFEEKIITKVIPFGAFSLSKEAFLNYYYSDPEKPFCKNYIDPKLKILLHEFSCFTKKEKLQHLK